VIAGPRLEITERNDAHASVRFAVRVQPRASIAGVAGLFGTGLKVRVHAPPVEGAANAAVIEVIAAALGVAKREVRIVGGQSSRSKVVEVTGLTADQVRARLRL
jgi:uncharacterized protein (TIGR00251 family)